MHQRNPSGALRSQRAQIGRNLQDVRLLNRALIFRTIREAGAISRAELAQRSHLHPATVTHITRELLQQGMIEEAGFADSDGGRRRALLRIRTQQGLIIAVRLARHHVEGALTDLHFESVVRRTITSSSLSDPATATLPVMLELIRSLIEVAGRNGSTVLGIGICAPGPLHGRRGEMIAPPNFPGWTHTPIRSIVEAETGLVTFLDNDANAAALAEKWFGAGRERESFAYILVEDGVGGGLVLDGDIYRGAHDVAGEIGHTSINFAGPPCDCGNRGCLELYAAPAAVEAYVSEALAAGRPSRLRASSGSPAFEGIAQAAREGDALAVAALDAMADALTTGIVNVTNLFDPDAVLVGGKIALAADLLLPALLAGVASRAIAHGAPQVPIAFGTLGVDPLTGTCRAPLIGAFCLVLRDLFERPGRSPAPPAPAQTLAATSLTGLRGAAMGKEVAVQN